MTEYKRWLPIILFSIFLFIMYNLNRFYKTEHFDYSPFSLSGSGIQITFNQDECLDDLSWISQDKSVTCPTLSEGDPRCNFVDVNGFTGFEKCPRSCDNCQDQLFPGDSANDAMLSAPDALYDNETGEMMGQVRQGGEMTMGGSTMATFSDKRLYEIEEEFKEKLESMEESISELLGSVYDDILLAVAEQSGIDVTCLRNWNTSDNPSSEPTTNRPNDCTDMHEDGYGATYCDSIDDCLECGDTCPSNKEIAAAGITVDMDPIYKISQMNEICTTLPVAAATVADPANTLFPEWNVTNRTTCCGVSATVITQDSELNAQCFGEFRPRNDCCFTPYELNFPSYKRGMTDIPITTYNLSVNLNDDQDQINVHNLEKCINNSNTEEFEVFKWMPTNVSPDGDELDEMPDLPIENTDINRNLGIMLPLNVKTNCYELKEMEKYFGPELTDYSCKNQIFTKSVDGRTIEWKNLYERCPIRCNENCRNLFNPDNNLGLQIKEGGNEDLYSDLTHADAHYESNVDYLKKISNELHDAQDPPVKIDGERYMIDDIKKYMGVSDGANIDGPYEAGRVQDTMNIIIDDNP